MKREIKGMLTGLGVTFRTMMKPAVTVQYPHEREDPAPRSRGVIALKEENRTVREIAWNEVAALVPLVVMMVWIGVYPNVFLRKMTPSVEQLIATVERGREEGKAMVAQR